MNITRLWRYLWLCVDIRMVKTMIYDDPAHIQKFSAYFLMCRRVRHRLGTLWSLSLCLIDHTDMKTYGRVKVQLHACLTSAVRGDEWPYSRPGCFSPGKDCHISIWQEFGWAAHLLWMLCRRTKSLVPGGNRTPILRLSSRYPVVLPIDPVAPMACRKCK